MYFKYVTLTAMHDWRDLSVWEGLLHSSSSQLAVIISIKNSCGNRSDVECRFYLFIKLLV